ncbi:S41 family peptidase [Winogradskyella aurantiaca]|uniref:S41 family peptidase n=1 Tax=Winogradskyella aurantiaca TaxID=2219558 RepID=UPI000E1D8B90|nr:S41 family peptidase [Winogradskyella aurantiaca]
MRISKFLLGAFLLTSLSSCFEDIDDNFAEVSEINDFVWTGLNGFYVYKDQVPDLANSRFNTRAEYSEFINQFSAPEDLFESLIYDRNNVDRFSLIVPNYIELEQTLQGQSRTTGMVFGLRFYPGESERVFGYVRYVLQGTPAESQGVQRGMIFNGVDGEQLTASNFRELLLGENLVFNINLAEYNDNGTPQDNSDDSVISTDDDILLAKINFNANPIYRANITEVGDKKIGYLMYNAFRSSNLSLTQLNALMDFFGSQGINDLVLDLRYNGGGNVNAAVWLSCMITGQFTGNLFFKENWNSEAEAILESQAPGSLDNPFVDEMLIRNQDGDVTFQQGINSLNLNRVYVLTTASTASASELVINGLRPYIDVIQIGTSTQGKPQASITLYDSPNFLRDGANPSHTYAMQPLIYEAENASGFSSYYNGLPPTAGFEQSENYANMGVLGNPEEPLFARAIQDITGNGRLNIESSREDLKTVPDSEGYNILLDSRPNKLKSAAELLGSGF